MSKSASKQAVNWRKQVVKSVLAAPKTNLWTGEFELANYSMQQMIGVDISDQMLMITRQKLHAYPHVSFYTAPAPTLPFPNYRFDVVVSASSFHYFDDPAALAEMKRVLKPGGTVVILDWCKDYLLCRLCDILLKVFDPAYKQC